MQLSNIIIATAAEAIIALLICTLAFFIYARKLKRLVNRQQEMLLSLLKTQATPQTEIPAITHNYKTHINKELDATTAEFAHLAPGQDIALALPENSALAQRILALRYAFLRAEELGTTEEPGTAEYWSIFQQALEPLLISHANNTIEVEPKTSQEHNHQDSPTADEIAKLRHVAADQYRIIHELQHKLHTATTMAQKELVIHELQQQLDRLIRFAEESETCIKLLENELTKAHAEILAQEKMLRQSSTLSETNQHSNTEPP